MPLTLTARQLIYTNVEADLSPTRQRGFQVWLASADLTPDQRRAVARRVDDFRLPPDAGPEDVVARHVFARPVDGLVMIAQCVPLPGKDKFGRGGKFHAHALLFTETEFARIGNNPFRVIDSGFEFHWRPEDVSDKPGDGWRAGTLPAVEVPVADPPAIVPAIPPMALARLAAHVERDDGRTVVIADKPAAVLQTLRTILLALPPVLRVRAWFDTLSTGASLGQVRYPLVGCPSAAAIRGWAFRKIHQLDAAKWCLTPPLAHSGPFPDELFLARCWEDLPDEDRDRAWDLGRRFISGEAAGLNLDQVPAPVASLLAGSPALVAAATEAWKTALPYPRLTQRPAVQDALRNYLDGPADDRFRKLAEPPPLEVVAAALARSLTSPGAEEPSESELSELQQLLATLGRGSRLAIVLSRWRAGDGDVARIREAANSVRGDWVRSTLPPALVGEDVGELSQACGTDRTLTARLKRDLRVAAALSGDSEFGRRLSYLDAYHTGPSRFADYLDSADKLPRPMTVGIATDVERLVRPERTPVWLSAGMGDMYLGVVVKPPAGEAKRLWDKLLWLRQVPRPTEPSADGGPRGFFDPPPETRSLSVVSDEEILFALIPAADCRGRDAEGTDERGPDPQARQWYDRLHEAKPAQVAERVEGARAFLTAADDETFRTFANWVIKRARAEPRVYERGGEPDLVGVRVRPAVHPVQTQRLVETVAGAVAPELAEGGKVRPTAGRRLPRFFWLLARLANPAGTERLPLPIPELT